MCFTWIISGASGPHMDAPSTLSVSESTTSFMIVFSCRLKNTSLVTYLPGRWTRKQGFMTNKTQQCNLECEEYIN
jgi:hypothetical protein